MGETSRITSLDVARRAGVSQSAVSRVFSGASASADTARKVRAAADALGYRPNSLARAMITGKSGIIGLVISYLDNQFYPVALEVLSQELKSQGYHVLIFMARNQMDAADEVVQELMSYQVDGIITASVPLGSDLTARCAERSIPVVMFNRGQPGASVSSVTSANFEGGRQAALHFVQSGHHRIAQITGWAESSTGRDRAEGFRAGLQEHAVCEVGAPDGAYSQPEAAEAARALMQSHTPPDAIFVGNDHMAFAVLDVLRHDLGCSVPEDVAIIGYDDVPQAAWKAYDLSTVRQPVLRMVRATIDVLIGQISDPTIASTHIEIPGTLIERGTTRPIQESSA